MKYFLSPVAVVLISAVSLSANATQLEGWYGGASLGTGVVNVETSDWNDGTLTGMSLDKRAVSYKLIAAYRFTPEFGLEGSYFHFGDVKFNGFEPGTTSSIWLPGPVSGKAEAKGLGLQAVGTLPFRDRFGLFAKGGLLIWNTTQLFNPTLSGGTLALSNEVIQHDYGIRWVYGAGIDIRFLDRWHARLEWEHYLVRFAGTTERDATLSSLGVTFDF